jgi:hypothetical protein
MADGFRFVVAKFPNAGEEDAMGVVSDKNR